MDRNFDIPDSTDWAVTPLPEVGHFESALRCQICKDFFDTPVITSCCHTFCSLCIRRCLSAEGRCPVCRSNDQELKLRRNWAVGELVESFKAARPSILDFARKNTIRTTLVSRPGSEDNAEGPASKRRRIDSSAAADSASTSDTARRTRSQARKSENGARAEDEPIVIQDSADDEDYEPGMNLRFLVQYTLVVMVADRYDRRWTRGVSPINYALFKDNSLRKKLKELGIPDSGPKPILQKRHTEWMNLWNANCDAINPKSKRDLLRDLDMWERTQGGLAVSQSSSRSNSSIMKKDFDVSAWSETHDDDYRKLIANARTMRATRAVAPSEVGEGQSNDKEDREQQPPTTKDLELEETGQPAESTDPSKHEPADPVSGIETESADRTVPVALVAP
ncbi:postreplication repair E3 ubiquitin-protein ligase rad18 [Arthroderma uncinatum]|uniref:postreplication repair E3 ubiquitin-protein ligase rad18 n=1 Tax=Arthroderma uncinatum TaxID=74035 RepID=UPI00144A6A56|nr:postreplication repair E3 ubiquitin-protein ligase rad18 [Arthroderma uncinatum]KAF3483314.1 postreplication repair E3 ubiquitin-protein ligase rad18 [Arthroderma uncinatum]